MTEPEVANVLGMITYQQELDLATLAQSFEERDEITSVSYEPAENHWLQSRFAPDDTYVAFYRRGRCSITGCKSVGQFHTVVDRVNEVMEDLLGFEYKPKVEVRNIVATADVNQEIPLDVLNIELGLERSEYEPEQFPALIYRCSGYVVLIFASGKLLCTGLTNEDAVSASIEDICSKIRNIT